MHIVENCITTNSNLIQDEDIAALAGGRQYDIIGEDEEKSESQFTLSRIKNAIKIQKEHKDKDVPLLPPNGVSEVDAVKNLLR